MQKECKCGKLLTRITPNTDTFYVVFCFIYTINAFLWYLCTKTYITWIFLNPFRLQFSLKLIVFNQLRKDLWYHIPPSKVSKPVPETSSSKHVSFSRFIILKSSQHSNGCKIVTSFLVSGDISICLLIFTFKCLTHLT